MVWVICMTHFLILELFHYFIHKTEDINLTYMLGISVVCMILWRIIYFFCWAFCDRNMIFCNALCFELFIVLLALIVTAITAI